MMAHTLTADHLDRLQPGDIIIAIDGEDLDRPVTVEAALGATGVPGVKLAPAHPSAVEWYLYPAMVGDSVTVQRGEVAAPRRERRKVTIRKYGVPLVRDGHGAYRTEDGRYEVQLNDGYESECDAPHPVRIGREMYLLVSSALNGSADQAARDAFHFVERWYGWPYLRAVRAGRDGYLCPGGATHFYSKWVVWDNKIDDYLGGSAEVFDRFGDAARSLTRHLETARGTS